MGVGAPDVSAGSGAASSGAAGGEAPSAVTEHDAASSGVADGESTATHNVASVGVTDAEASLYQLLDMPVPTVRDLDQQDNHDYLLDKGSALPADPKIQTKNETYEKSKNENLQKLIILEGFMQNGFQNRNQRIFLRRTSYVKIGFRHFLKNLKFLIVNRVFECLICELLPI